MNATENKSTNDSQERRVCTYLPPKYHRYFQAYFRYQEARSESETAADIIKKFFDSMQPQEREKMINFSKNSY